MHINLHTANDTTYIYIHIHDTTRTESVVYGILSNVT